MEMNDLLFGKWHFILKTWTCIFFEEYLSVWCLRKDHGNILHFVFFPSLAFLHTDYRGRSKKYWKYANNICLKCFKDIHCQKNVFSFSFQDKQLIVYVESKVLEEPDLVADKDFDQFRLKMKSFKDGRCWKWYLL